MEDALAASGQRNEGTAVTIATNHASTRMLSAP
jgi:hypothetical protein